MPNETVAPWSDWKAIELSSLLWGTGNGVLPTSFALLTSTANLAVDQLNQLQTVDQKNAIPPFRPTFNKGATGSIGFAAFQAAIAFPDAIGMAQRGRFTGWNAADAGAAGDAQDGDGTLRLALQVELMLVSVSFPGSVQTPNANDLLLYSPSAQFRGAGAPIVTPASGGLDTTQDCPVAGSTWLTGGTVSAFPDLECPSEAASTDANPAPFFDPNGVCRLQTLFEIPATCSIGDMIDLQALIEIAAANVVGVQFNYLKYRFIAQPFPFDTNTTLQLDGSTDVLEEQSRLDTIPYTP